jgi:hypothetical protein
MPSADDERCFWCGAENPDDRDHVFPQSLFAAPRPSTLISVPACQGHNRLFSMDEEYFRDFVVGSSYGHPEARRLWNTTIRRSLRRKPSYRAMLAGQIRRLEIKTPGGVSLGVVDALLGDVGRIRNVLRKMTRGLYYHLYSEPLGPIALTVDQIRFDRPLPPAAEAIVRGLPPRSEVGHVKYQFARTPDEPGGVAGLIIFFDRVRFIVVGMPSANDDRIDLPTGRRRSGGLWLPPMA